MSNISVVVNTSENNVVVSSVGIQGATGATGFPGSSGGGGANGEVSFQQTFTQSNLSIAGLIPITYSAAIPASGLVVYDNVGNTVNPDHWRSLSATTIEINLESFVPIVGTWTASISL